jgi:hypothetical protein
LFVEARRAVGSRGAPRALARANSPKHGDDALQVGLVRELLCPGAKSTSNPYRPEDDPMRIDVLAVVRACLAALIATGLTLCLGERSARATCNPFISTCTTTVAPDVPFNGFIEFNVSSSGCSGFAQGGVQMARECADFVPISMGTTIQQKCQAIVAQINASCGTQPGQAQFQADGSACAMGTFTVTDETCLNQTAVGTGVTLLLASSTTVAPGTFTGSGMLPDYEQDIITNGCQSGSDAVAALGGKPTGSAINGNTSSVLFVVATPSNGTVVETVPTTAMSTIPNIVSLAVAKANLSLTAVGSNIRCKQDATTPSVAKCAAAPDGGVGDSPVTGVPVTFQVNDTGVTRAAMTGPSKDIQAATQAIHTSGGIPNVATFNFVGGPTCSPCDGGPGGAQCCVTTLAVPTPAMTGWQLMVLAFVLGACGVVLVRRGRAGPRQAS